MVRKFRWYPFPIIEKTNILSNPYCGLYSMYRFYAEPNTNREEGISLDNIVISPNQQMCLLEINLIDFNDKSLSMDALQNIKDIFNYFSFHRKQMIVRFLYDWEGKGVLSEPKDIGFILDHMGQVSDLLKEFQDDIYIIQGLFIGSWGEMHNSRYLSEAYMTRLANKLYESSGHRTQIALRCPSFWRMIFRTNQPLDANTAYSDLRKARFSLFNDGMLGSDTDYGTYGNIHARDANNYSDKWIRKDELDFQYKLCSYVSNGGEVINNNKYNDVLPAIKDLKKMRVSYLHNDYDQQVLDKWKTSKSGLLNPLWKDKSAFEYIVAHLGYRFLIKDIKISSPSTNRLKVKVKICNRGFAPCYHRFDVKLAVVNIRKSEAYEYLINTDTRFWFPNEVVELVTLIDTDKLKEDQYILCLSIYDSRSRKYIEIANNYSQVEDTAYYKLGNINIY